MKKTTLIIGLMFALSGIQAQTTTPNGSGSDNQNGTGSGTQNGNGNTNGQNGTNNGSGTNKQKPQKSQQPNNSGGQTDQFGGQSVNTLTPSSAPKRQGSKSDSRRRTDSTRTNP